VENDHIKNIAFEQLIYNGKSINLGHYDDPMVAHAVYMNAARSHFGEHARAK
jgi:hypothetical protein